MPTTTVTDNGYTTEYRGDRAIEVRCPLGLIACFATPVVCGIDNGPWIVTYVPDVAAANDPDWPSFDLPDRAQAERLLKLFVALHAGQPVTA